MVLKKRLIIAVIALSLFGSCSGNDEPKDPKIITDDNGLIIDLEWSTGGSTSQSLNEVDLDLRLLKGTTVVESSLSGYSFEQVEIKDIYSDGEYVLQIVVDYASKGSNYSVFVSGIKSKEVKEYNGTTTAAEQGASIEFIKIIKQGNKYNLSR